MNKVVSTLLWYRVIVLQGTSNSSGFLLVILITIAVLFLMHKPNSFY